MGSWNGTPYPVVATRQAWLLTHPPLLLFQPFGQITNLTDVAEGTIVRVITRLDQTCMEVRDAARVIGDADLFQKMEEAQVAIRRDVIFAASLYVSGDFKPFFTASSSVLTFDFLAFSFSSKFRKRCFDRRILAR
jgi:hypothetical protein